MTEHAGPRSTPALPHERRPVLRVAGGTDVTPATAPSAASPEPSPDRAAAARAAHPSSGPGVPGARRFQVVSGDGPARGTGRGRLSRADLAVIIRIEEA